MSCFVWTLYNSVPLFIYIECIVVIYLKMPAPDHSAQDQICFVIADPHDDIQDMSVMDLFECGGELLAIRKREASAAKKSSESEGRSLMQKIEAVTEAKWKKRLLSIVQSSDRN